MSPGFDRDLVVIGAGSGGVRAARVAAELGARVTIVERAAIGGTCVNAGCIPKKLLTFAAELGRGARTAAEARAQSGRPSEIAPVPWAWARAAKDREVARLNAAYLSTLDRAGVEVVRGEARLRDAHTVAVGEQELRSRYLLVATGGRPVLPSIPGAEHGITSDQAFHLAELPRRIAIVGGGYVGLEFASIFHGLGSEVTVVVRRARVLRGFDDDAREHLALELAAQGIALRYRKEPASLVRTQDGLALTLSDGAVLDVDQVLFAIGRRPNARELGLEQQGVALRADGAVQVDAYGRSSLQHVFAIGDCTGHIALTPIAIAEGENVARSLFGPAPIATDYSLVPTAVFSHPELAWVGLGEDEAVARGHSVRGFRSVFRPLEAALHERPERALVKLVVDRATDRVLGCGVVAEGAAEIVQALAIALRAGVTKAQLDATLPLHPTLAEELLFLRTPVS